MITMSIWFHIIVFGLTGLLIYVGVYYGVPRLEKAGLPRITAFFGALWIPSVLLLPLSIFFYIWLEGGSLGETALIERFRLQAFDGRDSWWVVAAVVITVLADQLLEPVGKFFAKVKIFSPPSYLPAPFNPLRKMSLPPRDFFGVTLHGNWKLLLIFIPLHLLAMFSEEMMWRGYLLPLQEMFLGDFAWVFNGMLWAWLVHAVLKWHFIGMIPGMLVTPFIAQFTQSTWASVIVHAVPNALLWILLVWGVLSRPEKEQQSDS